MKSPISVTNRKQTASFRMVSLMLAIAPLCLMLAAANTSAHAQTSAPSPADWTQFHRDNMQRWNPYETILNVNNVGGLTLKWSFTIGQNPGFNEVSSTAVVNGVAYFGSVNGNLYALDAGTGAKLWSYTTGAMVLSSPAVANGIVYVGSTDHNVYALNASTGAKLWTYATGDQVGSSSPAVVNGVVYIGSLDHNVYARNATTGAKLWSFTMGLGSGSSPAVVNGVVYIVSADVNLYALNASTGAKLWSHVGAYAAPAVANGVVYVGGSENVYALNAATGALLWNNNIPGFIAESAPAVANGVVYIGSYDHNLYALNASTGAKLWSYRTGNQVTTSPAVANGVVYVGSADGSVYALNASTGAKLWSYATGSGITSSPAIVDGVLYILADGTTTNTTGVKNVSYAFSLGAPGSADLFLRIQPSATTVHQGDLLTFAFSVWNLGPAVAEGEVLSNLQVPAGTTFDYVRVSGTPGLGTCTTPPYGGTGQILCHEGDGMAPNTTWTVRLTVKVTAAAGSTITANAATMADTPDPNLANNTATASVKVQ